jgi:hypothetical protein
VQEKICGAPGISTPSPIHHNINPENPTERKHETINFTWHNRVQQSDPFFCVCLLSLCFLSFFWMSTLCTYVSSKLGKRKERLWHTPLPKNIYLCSSQKCADSGNEGIYSAWRVSMSNCHQYRSELAVDKYLYRTEFIPFVRQQYPRDARMQVVESLHLKMCALESILGWIEWQVNERGSEYANTETSLGWRPDSWEKIKESGFQTSCSRNSHFLLAPQRMQWR